MRKLTTSRGSYEELVPVEFGLYTEMFFFKYRHQKLQTILPDIQRIQILLRKTVAYA